MIEGRRGEEKGITEDRTEEKRGGIKRKEGRREERIEKRGEAERRGKD